MQEDISLLRGYNLGLEAAKNNISTLKMGIELNSKIALETIEKVLKLIDELINKCKEENDS